MKTVFATFLGIMLVMATSSSNAEVTLQPDVLFIGITEGNLRLEVTIVPSNCDKPKADIIAAKVYETYGRGLKARIAQYEEEEGKPLQPGAKIVMAGTADCEPDNIQLKISNQEGDWLAFAWSPSGWRDAGKSW